MKEIELTNDLKSEIVDYMVNLDTSITSKNTIRSYTNILDRIFKNYNVLNKNTQKEMLKRWNKKTKITALFSKMNEFFDLNEIEYIIKYPKTKRKGRHIPDIISREELKEIMKPIPEDGKLIISCIFNIGAGLRISELINLEWGNITWNQWSKEKRTISVKIVQSKNNTDRWVPIPHFTVAELYEYAEKTGKISHDGIPSGGKIFDFGSEEFEKELRILDKEKWEYKYHIHCYDFIRHNLINRYFKKIDNKHITAHSLRHSRATELHNVYKVPISKIQEWLGHKDISTTMIYVHMSTKGDEELMENIGGV